MKIVDLVEKYRAGEFYLAPGHDLRVCIDKGRAYFAVYSPHKEGEDEDDAEEDCVQIPVEENNGADQLYALLSHAGLNVDHA